MYDKYYQNLYHNPALNLSSFLARVLIPPQRPFPDLVMLNNRSWISQFIRYLRWWVVEVCTPELPQLRKELTNIISCWVAFCALRIRVEEPEVWRRVCARRSAPLPTTVVRGKVAVDEGLHKVLYGTGLSLHEKVVCGLAYPLAQSPVDHKIFGQEHRGDHPHPVVHPTCKR